GINQIESHVEDNMGLLAFKTKTVEDQRLKILIKTALIFIVFYFVINWIGIGLILGVFAKQIKSAILSASLLAILNISSLTVFSFYYYKKYFGMNIFKQPLQIGRFRSNLGKNLTIGLVISLVATMLAVSIRKIIDPSFHLIFNPKELLILYRLIFQILHLGIFGPIAEEILFRGFFYRLVEKLWNAKFSIGAIVLLEMILHPRFEAFPGGALLTVMLCISYTKTRSLHKPIIIHIAYNLTGMVLGFLIFPSKPGNL
ncbi:MAG: hypothetical protein A2145_06200, partial [candidate division Zixibacteria bacterium RBG_16_40_9]